MRTLNVYNNVKIIIFSIGICLTIFAIHQYGLVDSHTPPLGFILPLFFMVLGLFWMIIDWGISYFSKAIQINYYINYVSVFINFIIIILILVDAI